MEQWRKSGSVAANTREYWFKSNLFPWSLQISCENQAFRQTVRKQDGTMRSREVVYLVSPISWRSMVRIHPLATNSLLGSQSGDGCWLWNDILARSVLYWYRSEWIYYEKNGYDLVNGRHSEKFRDLGCVIYFFKREAKLIEMRGEVLVDHLANV